MKKLWGGVFSTETNPEVQRYLESSFDTELVEENFDVTLAHALALCKAGKIRKSSVKKVLMNERKVIGWIREHRDEFEDVHTAVEWAFRKWGGQDMRNLRAGRSRNDEVITSSILWTLRRTTRVLELLRKLVESQLSNWERFGDRIIPSYTHMKRAFPTLWAYWLSGYIASLERDAMRFLELVSVASRCPLGSGATAGTGVRIDEKFIAKILGFSSPVRNGQDAVGRRDILAQAVFACTTLSLTLSKIANDIITLSTDEFGYVELDESVCTGSSQMPHKKNPDPLEIMRGKFSRVLGNLVSILTLEKGLLSGYSRDLQEDKPPLFDSFETVESSLRVLAIVFENLRVKGAGSLPDYTLSTDCAEILFERGMMWDEAHRKVGQLVREGKKLREIFRIDEMGSIKRKRTLQSTSPVALARMRKVWVRFSEHLSSRVGELEKRFSHGAVLQRAWDAVEKIVSEEGAGN